MDLSQLLSSGFQFLNLDDACEAEVDILNDMLFKHQDVTQLSKLFHLKTLPDYDGNLENSPNRYFVGGPIHVQSLLPAQHGEDGDEPNVVLSPDNPDLHLTDTHLDQQHQQQQQQQQDAVVNEQQQQQPLTHNPAIATDASIPIANGPLMPISPQHHVINVEGNAGEISQSGEMSGQMMTSIPPPIRSYYSQQHVSVVHGSPQTQVGSPAMGQPHGQLVSPGYPHVSVPISMHQQQVIMMQQAQAVHSYVGTHQPTLHYVPSYSQRHHGHPQHSFVQGEPLSPESVQYHHNPNLIKVTHDPSTLPHSHPSNPSPQGGPSKYSNGPRKNHSRNIDRNRRTEPDSMMNNYPTYYPNIAFPGMAYYNQHQQLAHTAAVTGSPIIMSAGGHHNKVPVTMYSPYGPSHQQQYNSPPPSVQQGPITPQTSPPESQQQQPQPLQQHQQQPPEPNPAMVASHPHQQHQQQQQHLPPPPSSSPPQQHQHQLQSQEENLNEENIQSEHIQGPSQGQHPHHSDVPSHVQHGQPMVPIDNPNANQIPNQNEPNLPHNPNATKVESELNKNNLTCPVPFINTGNASASTVSSSGSGKNIKNEGGEDGGGGRPTSSSSPSAINVAVAGGAVSKQKPQSQPQPHHQSNHSKKQQQVQLDQVPSNHTHTSQDVNVKRIASPSNQQQQQPPHQQQQQAQVGKQQKPDKDSTSTTATTPLPDLVQPKQNLMNKCSSPDAPTKENRLPSQPTQTPPVTQTPTQPQPQPHPPSSNQNQNQTPVAVPVAVAVPPKAQTWAETSAPKSYRATTAMSNSHSNSSSNSTSNNSSSGSVGTSGNLGSSSSTAPNVVVAVDEKALKEKPGQGQNKSASAEFPALAKINNVNGSSSGNISGTSSHSSGSGTSSTSNNVATNQTSPDQRTAAPSSASASASASAAAATATAASSAPKGRSWASICKRQDQGYSIAPTSSSSSTSSGGAPPSASNGGQGQEVSASDKASATDNNGASYVPIQGQGHGSGSDNKSKTSSSTPPSATSVSGSSGASSSAASGPQSSSSSTAANASSSHHSHDPHPPFDLSCLNNENDALAIRLGEFLTYYTLDHHATALTPRGLTNQSNYCYINSTLQALMACPPFVNLFRSMREVGLGRTPCKATPIIQSVFDFVSEFEPLNRGGNSNKRDRRSDSFITGANLEPSGIRKVLGLFDGSTFKVEGRQQDAEEFLSHLLNGLHDEMIKVMRWYENSKMPSVSSHQAAVLHHQQQQQTHAVLNGGQQHVGENVGTEEDDDADHWQVMGPKNKGCLTRKTNVVKSPISEMLFGQLCSALHRTNSFKSVALQPFFTLQLDIQNDSIRSVRDALEGLSFKEEVSGLVSNSGQETEAYRQLTLEELPMILILHLKRFVYDKSGNKILKLDKKLDFGIDLEVAKEHLSQTTRGKCTPKQRQYKLFAVVYHDGEEAYKGHYIADCFHPSGGNLWGQVGWLRYDDITVKPIAENLMLNSQPPRVPYLLYYRRADTLVSHVQNPRKDRPRNFGGSES